MSVGNKSVNLVRMLVVNKSLNLVSMSVGNKSVTLGSMSVVNKYVDLVGIVLQLYDLMAFIIISRDRWVVFAEPSGFLHQ
jgi:hypothetical protein